LEEKKRVFLDFGQKTTSAERRLSEEMFDTLSWGNHTELKYMKKKNDDA